MSRSNSAEIKNPATRFFKWSGSEGKISYYDKEAKENIFVDTPMTFLVLDRLTTITGYSDEDSSGIWSNEIKDTRSEILTVRTKHGIKKQGLYQDVKTVTGAKYAQSLYIAYHGDDKKLQIGNFKMSGCAVSAWIEFSKGIDIYQGAVSITGKVEGKKGATKFFSPTFAMISAIKPETNDAANALDRQLQDYLKEYFKLRGNQPEQTTDDYIAQRNAELEDFEGESAKSAAASGGDSWKGALGENDFSVSDSDDIPFALLFALFGLGLTAMLYAQILTVSV